MNIVAVNTHATGRFPNNSAGSGLKPSSSEKGSRPISSSASGRDGKAGGGARVKFVLGNLLSYQIHYLVGSHPTIDFFIPALPLNEIF